MKNLKNKLFIIFSLLCALALTSCMDLYDGSEVPTSFKVTFDGNGGSYIDGGIAATTYSQIYAFAEQKNLIANKFSKANCKFLGWAESATATTATFADEANFSTKTDRTLYAIWSEVTYTVTFVGNGGSTSEGKNTYTQDFKVGEEKALEKMKFVAPEGKTFKGWTETAGTSTCNYHDMDKISVKEDLTLYAVWIWTSNVCTITFEGNDGSTAGGATSYTQELEIGTTEPLRENMFVNPPQAKYFYGWATTANATSKDYSDGQSYPASSPAVTLYAVWVDTNLYVSPNGNDSNSGLTHDLAFKTLQRVVKEITDSKKYGATLDWNVYIDGSVEGNTNIENLIAKSITLAKDPTVGVTTAELNGSNSGTVLKVSTDSDIRINDVTITGGRATDGAGIYIDNASAKITLNSGAKVSDNTATNDGAGVYIKKGHFIVNGGEIISNTATRYGGGVCIDSGEMIFQDGYIGKQNEGNKAAEGAGIYNKGTVKMSSGHITNNEAKNGNNGNGCGVYNCNTGIFEMSSGAITNNFAGVVPTGDINVTSRGGGIYNSGTVNLKGDAIIGTATQASDSSYSNYANQSGGGIYNVGVLTFEDNCTCSIQGNHAKVSGGGLWFSSTSTFTSNTFTSTGDVLSDTRIVLNHANSNWQIKKD